MAFEVSVKKREVRPAQTRQLRLKDDLSRLIGSGRKSWLIGLDELHGSALSQMASEHECAVIL
jgi:hypothetical protein